MLLIVVSFDRRCRAMSIIHLETAQRGRPLPDWHSSQIWHRCENAFAFKGRQYGGQSRSRKSAQDDKWSFCLMAGTLCAANRLPAAGPSKRSQRASARMRVGLHL